MSRREGHRPGSGSTVPGSTCRCGAAGRPIEIIYVNPRHAKVLQQLPQLRRRPLPVGLRLKLGLASPYAVHIYSNSFGTTVG